MVPEAIEVMNGQHGCAGNIVPEKVMSFPFPQKTSNCFRPAPHRCSLRSPRLAAAEGVKTICEVGFNAGHSALRWLTYSSAKAVFLALCFCIACLCSGDCRCPWPGAGGALVRSRRSPLLPTGCHVASEPISRATPPQVQRREMQRTELNLVRLLRQFFLRFSRGGWS